jgi:aspartate/methionine/tyrosine aminotransferase
MLENKDFSINPEKILSLINNNTRLLILNNPNNPTGAFTEKNKIDQLAEGLKKFPNVAILSDEIYSRQIFDGKKMPTFFDYPDLYDRLIVLDGWSKAYSMTGWRLGWSVWPEKLVEQIIKFCVNNHSCVNAAIQYGGIAALDGPDDSINFMMEKFTKRRKLIYEGLNDIQGIECTMPGGGFYAFPKVIGTGMNGKDFAKKCLHDAGVAIVPGTAFGKKAIDYVRFSFAASEDNISKALENIKKMLS